VSEDVVRAAGGVVARGAPGKLEIVLVHRPKYDDWSLPKGKCRRGESDEACAVREVEEETGLSCVLTSELASTSYHDSAGRPKVARYWLMRPAAGTLGAANEVDDARWFPLEEAIEMLTYERDRGVLRSLRES
jgi:8-oxo-dGTP diphosphatase